LYWSKVQGTADAKTIEPDEDYILPLGKARIAKDASQEKNLLGESIVVITYGMGVYWASEAALAYKGQVEIVDLRTLNPIDWNCILASVKRHGRVLILTEEPLLNSFAESLAGRISKECFQWLDAPVWTLGAANLPAIPLNVDLEKMMLPSVEKVKSEMHLLLTY
jgi:2-oxoisovalerate dehydrogenase E1 component